MDFSESTFMPFHQRVEFRQVPKRRIVHALFYVYDRSATDPKTQSQQALRHLRSSPETTEPGSGGYRSGFHLRA
jgi:hypothetical protein